MAAARERPGKLNYGHAGTGNTLHLAIELLKARTGIKSSRSPTRTRRN